MKSIINRLENIVDDLYVESLDFDCSLLSISSDLFNLTLQALYETDDNIHELFAGASLQNIITVYLRDLHKEHTEYWILELENSIDTAFKVINNDTTLDSSLVDKYLTPHPHTED